VARPRQKNEREEPKFTEMGACGQGKGTSVESQLGASEGYEKGKCNGGEKKNGSVGNQKKRSKKDLHK